MYKISVIIPVFNAEKTLSGAFNSILNQTFDFNDIEVIFVDDCSNDNSRNIIMDFVNQYDNVKLICNEQNSGYAGKPRNVGILNASADYLMFLDPDDEFYDDAFEFLYNKITDNDVDFVSGNYSQLTNGKYVPYGWDFIDLDYETYINSIKENMDLLRLPSSVFTKIIKKSLIIDNNIKFPEDVPSQDLVFIGKTLLKANGIIFINHPIVKYAIWEGKSQTSKMDKKSLSGNIKAYTLFYNDLIDFDKDYGWISLIILHSYWMKRFILSDATRQEKIDVLKSGEYLFNEYKKSKKAKPLKRYKELFDLIYEGKYLEAVKLSEYLAFLFAESKENIAETVKNKDIFFLFGEFNLNMGGIGTTVINRASYLADKGYNITLLNVQTIRNYEFIRNHFYEMGFLSKRINFVNLYEHYSNKNTLDFKGNPTLQSNLEAASYFTIEKVLNEDNSINLFYYQNDELIKKELYVDDCLIYDEIGFNRNFYTKDGFKYLSRVKRNGKSLYILYARKIACPMEFTSLSQLLYYFINEICFTSSNDKPFLVCDSTDHWYNFVGIDENQAYKIASMHGNPFLVEENKHEINPRIKHFKILDELKAFVLLTDSVKNDLKKEVKYNHFVTIPNAFEDELLEYSPVKKDLNRFGIFSRISPEKQLHDAIKAFRIVSQKNDEAILEIYGRALLEAEKEELVKLTSLVEQLDLKDKVIFKGYQDDVSDEMKKSLCTLITSKHEGLPLALLESMAYSTPVISYDINYGPRDVITNGEDGILIEPNDVDKLAESMLYLLENPEIAVKMGEKAKEKIKTEFSIDVVGKKWENLFVEVYAKYALEDYKKNLKMFNDYDKLVKDNKSIKKENKSLKHFKKEMLSSTSWKITKPIRKLKEFLKKFKNN